MNKKIAVFPGSFDPFTVGHQSIVNRALPLFDKIIVGIGINQEKNSLFDFEKRKHWIELIFENNPKVEVSSFKGLTVEFCKQINAGFILRGLRTSADFEYERQIGQLNKSLFYEIETVFFLTIPEHTFISSSVVREIIKYKGDMTKYVPEIIAKEIMEKY